MKKGITILLAIAIISFLGFAFQTNHSASTPPQNSGIEFFDGTWEEALEKSKAENKLIFLDAYAAWCGPCKSLAKNVFTKSEVGAFFNANFINVKMDMEKHKEGPRLARKFGLRAYPSLYFIDANEQINKVSVGYVSAKNLIAIGQQVTK